MWLRAFHSIYAPQLAVRVLAAVRHHHTDATLRMIGPDKDGSLAKTRALATDLGVSSAVHFVAGVPKAMVPAELVKGEVFLNTTTLESFGVSPLEAAACGLALVTTGAGELSYLWQHEVDALVVPVNDSEAMGAAVLRLLREPELAVRIAANGRRKAELFDWVHVLPQWEGVLEQVAGKGQRGAGTVARVRTDTWM